jgi:GrpB-like predicted nucleotidyltransferase (UPF0157 family)
MMHVETYELAAPEFHEWSPDFSRVAGEVKKALLENIADIRVEHVGSTSVKDCGGKGVVDLLVLYRDQSGDFERVRDMVDELGFQQQQVGHAFPSNRPMRVGAVVYGAKKYRLHLRRLSSSG